MYIIEFEKGVYSRKGKGDPSRTLSPINAKKFECKEIAEKELINVLEQIKSFRTFKNPRVRWRDEVSGVLT